MGAGLLAKASGQSITVSTDPPLSRASPLPQSIVVAHTICAPIWRNASHQHACRDPSWCVINPHNRSKTPFPYLSPTGHSPC
ncbi:hypothetical protein C9422_24690 [Pseudomonas sp. B1(2018)]|nr:hypothetical protein C9422_24690 [Pseudomonas sp. B1(2018)]